MKRTLMLCCVGLLAVVCCRIVLAQEDGKGPDAAKAPELPVHFYHLEFVVQELGTDGKPVNSRSYTTMLSNGRGFVGSIRTGSRVPIQTSPSAFQYMDVGVNFDVRNLRETNGKLAIDLAADISSLATPAGMSQPSTPVTRNNKWQAPILIPLSKPTVVFTSDSLDTKGAMQVVVTATPLQ